MRRPASELRFSPLAAGLAARLAWAAGFGILLWIGVWWALG
jgi:hypothetical protein